MIICENCNGKDKCVCITCLHNGVYDGNVCRCITDIDRDTIREGDIMNGITSCSCYTEDWVKELKWSYIKASI